MNTRVLPLINTEFLKLAKSMREAQKESGHSQKAQRRARSLEALFDAKIDAYEKEIAKLQESISQTEMPLVVAEDTGGKS